NGTYLSSASNLTFNGVAASDQAGMSVALSDINNDGFADVIVSAPAADPNGNDVSGEVYVSYAKVTCTMINSNTTLNQNINANGNCFTVNASNVIIDGNGYNVTGNGSGIGINLTGFNNVIVKNVVFQNFSIGLYEAGGANNTLVQSILLSNLLNDTQIEANGGYNTTLLNVTLNRARIGVGSASILNLKWYVNVYVNDTAGNALDGVTVWGYNLTNGLEQNATTTSGNAQLALTELYQNGSTVTYMTNHTVNVTKNLYTSSPAFSNLNLSITNSTRATFILSLGCGIISADVNFSAVTLYKNGSCFNVTASNLMIDGKGLIVRGNGTGVGISLSNANNITFSNINIYNFSEGLSISGSNNSNFWNSIVFNSSNKDILVAANGGVNITFTNVTLGRNNVSIGENGSIIVRWLVKAIAASGASALANANISVINISGTIVASNITNSAGEAWMILTEFLQDNTSRYYYTPHNFTATKNGYANSTQQLNLTAMNSTTLSSNLLRSFSTCGHKLNESMTFQAVTINLSTNSSCFNVTANNLVIDGNGTVLLGNNTAYGGFLFDGGSNITLRNFAIRNFVVGVQITNPSDDLPDNITLQNFNISDTAYGIVLSNTADININDSYITNSSIYDVHLSFQYPDQVNYLTNVTFNKNSITSLQDVELQLKWYADVQVNDTSGNPIANVNVSAYKADGTLEETKNTSANGKVRLTLTELSHTTYGYSYVTPHSIIAFKPGYLNNLTSVDISTTNNTRVNFGLSMPSCGSTLSRNFTFGANLVSNDTCFTMGANNLAVNGYGYNLTGNGSGTGLSISSYRGLSVSNLQVNNFSTGVNFYLANDTSLRNVNITGAVYGIIFNNSNNNTLYDSFLSNNSVSILAVNNGGTVNSLVNTSVDINSINVSGTATVYVKWYVDVNVTYSGSYPLANANVTARFNSTGMVDYSAISDSNGIARLEVSELKKNVSGVFYLTPNNITIFFNSTLSGYSANSTIINISTTNNTKVSLGLNLSCTAPYDDLLLTANTVLCPGTFEISDGGSSGVIRISTAYNLTCDNTIIKGTGSGTGIALGGGDDFTISGCTVRDYDRGIGFGSLCADNLVVTSFNATSVSVGINSVGICNNFTMR
ncbi:MAG: FG-GAP repeat protein, partial [Nanoarchaeota archaeon]